ncbi:MAG: hypothetical protein IT287_04850 [Bdellovibrionaceae bacterium]|nr:hypothetical protein [Pseudobdellovibrionaceae bacterium]
MSNQRSISTALSYLYEVCDNGSIATLYLNRILATENTPSYISCNIHTTTKSGTTTDEIITSLGTTLTVKTDDQGLETSVTTKDGQITCKATFATANAGANDWCGLILKPSGSYVQIKPALISSDLTPAFYGKKPLAEYQTGQVKSVAPAEVIK